MLKPSRLSMVIVFLALWAGLACVAQNTLAEKVKGAPQVQVQANTLKVQPPHEGWALGMVSWIAVGRDGLIYMLQRGDKADPIVVANQEGHFIRSWGKGMYTMPHAIRIDPQGNVWTTDAASSVIYEFTLLGKKLTEIAVGGQPHPCRNIVQIEKNISSPSGFFL